MILSLLFSINFVAVAAAACAFFIIGSLWFSPLLFSSIWVKELEQHNVVIKQPTQADLVSKMLLTYAANFITAWAMGCLVYLTGSATILSGLILGTIVALGFAVTSVGSVFIWESRSLKLFLIDVGYPVVGIIVSAIILSLW